MIVNQTMGPAGRLGHQILQYAFLVSYAAEFGGDFATCPWEGEGVFNVQPGKDDLPDLPEVTEQPDAPDRCPVRSGMGRLDGRGVTGTFRDFGWLLAKHKPLLQTHFGYVGAAATQDADLAAALSAADLPVVALHMRRRQQGTGVRFRTPHLWATLALSDLRERRGPFQLVIVSDDKDKLASIYSGFGPVFAPDLLPEGTLPEHILDWQLLRRADVVLMSNSTFSFSACLLADATQTCLRPDLPFGGFRPCDPFAEPAILQTGMAEEYGSVFMSPEAQSRPFYRLGRLIGRYTRDARLSGRPPKTG